MSVYRHPQFSRRIAVQAGAVGLLGLGMNHHMSLQAADVKAFNSLPGFGKAKSLIYIFLSGGLAQQDSFDLKPDAPDDVRGEFNPASTKTPGTQICEHLPGLASISDKWSMCRSLTHPTNGHTLGHFFMLTGRSEAPAGFQGDRKPRPTTGRRSHLLSEMLCQHGITTYHRRSCFRNDWYTGREALYQEPMAGSWDQTGIHFSSKPHHTEIRCGGELIRNIPIPTRVRNRQPKQMHGWVNSAKLTLPHGMNSRRLGGRLGLLNTLDGQREKLENSANVLGYDSNRQQAISLLTDHKIATLWMSRTPMRKHRNGGAQTALVGRC